MPLLVPEQAQGSRAVTIDALRGLEAQHLHNEIERLAGSVQRLQESNDQLRSLAQAVVQAHQPGATVAPEAQGLNLEDAQELSQAAKENEETISDQRQLIHRMTQVLREKAADHAVPPGSSLGLPQT